MATSNLPRSNKKRSWFILCLLCFISMLSVSLSEDYLALSDSANMTNSFVYNPQNYICSDPDCGDVLAAVAGLAKRLLSDKRIYGGSSHKEEAQSRQSNDFYSSFLSSNKLNRFSSDSYSGSDYGYGNGGYSNGGYSDSKYGSSSDSSYGSNSNSYDNSRVPNLQGKYGGNIIASASGYDEGGSYGGGSSYGGGYGGGGSYGGDCCGKKDSLLPLLVVGSLGLLAFYLYLRTTTTAAGRRLNDLGDVDEDVYLDGPTWLSLIHELWEQDGVVEDPSCAQHTLCRMNNMAMSAPGQAGWAVSMSSLPLSYLLHRRHDGGFSLYMDAALMGRSGANCTLLYNACSRLH